MRAAVLESWRTPLVLSDDVELAEPRVGEVRVRVHHCGVCHSDLSIVDGHLPAPTPVVLGHEASGVVDAVGEGVTMLAPGDRVVLTPSPPCGHCYWCVRGEWSVCQNSVALMTGTLPDGTTPLRRDGSPLFRGLGVAAFAEHVITPATGAVRIPDDVPLELACVLGCAVQTGVGAVLNTARVPEGASVAVLGLGGVGLAVVQGARLAGASRIVASDPVAARREAALGFGATDVVDPTDTDVSAAVHDLTGGIGADYAFDAVGRSALVNTGLDAVRTGGTVVMVGMPPLDDPLTLSSATLFAATEKKLLGCLLGSVNSLREIPRLVDLWRVGRLDLEALVTGRRPLAEVNEALDDLRAARGIRTVLDVA
jgi:Zn-dependent alcohol dehydrogenase